MQRLLASLLLVLLASPAFAADVPAALLEYSASVTPAFLQGHMRLTDESVKEFAQIKGFQVAMTPLLVWR